MSIYDDIIDLPHHRSARRGHMSLQDRAAQFSPFAALTGFDAAIEETGRLTDNQRQLEEYGNTLLDRKLTQLRELLPRHPEVTITYFLPDSRKAGGAYAQVQGELKKIDLYSRQIFLMDGQRIPMDSILDMDSDLLTE